MTTTDDVANWFETERGIKRETLRAFGVTFDGRNVQFPYPNGVKERPDPTKPLAPDQRRFYFTRGVQPDLFQPPVQPAGDRAFLVEGETDAMRMWQETGGTVPVYGIGGINTWDHIPKPTVERLREYKQVFVTLDNDDDYMVKSQVNDAWRKVRGDLDRAKRVHFPHDVKDGCEFWDRYDAKILSQLCAKMGVSRYQPIDFAADPPVVHWLLKDWIALGDVTVLAGKGGLGKSLINQAIAGAIINGAPTVLGQPLEAAGNVLLVDEENPIDVVHDRMKRFGLDPTQHAGKLRYLANQHIRLDRDPHTLLDEALDFKPVFIGLDSLTRLHTVDENSNAEIAALFNNAITPLARETGAAVCLIHHHDKSARGPRGAGDIENAADALINVHEVDGLENTFVMRISKSRRKPKGSEIWVTIRDNPDGTLELAVRPPIERLTF